MHKANFETFDFEPAKVLQLRLLRFVQVQSSSEAAHWIDPVTPIFRNLEMCETVEKMSVA